MAGPHNSDTQADENAPVPIQCETWPAVLDSCFTTREHAEYFLSGRVRFGYLQATRQHPTNYAQEISGLYIASLGAS